MDLGLSGKTAVVTGGSTGIGLATARALAREGVRVVLCARDREMVQARAREISAEFGVEVRGVAADVTRPDDLARLVEEVESTFGSADILISNAGEGTVETILDAPDEKWQYFWDLHVMAAVRLARGFVPGMRRRGGGAIVHNASICARQPLPHEPIYNVTKAALAMFSKCLANELAKDGIRVNCINPGLILTRGWTDYADVQAPLEGVTPEVFLERIAREKAPIGRFGTPEELADFIAFLCSPRASYCTGSTYYVDGGWLNVVT